MPTAWIDEARACGVDVRGTARVIAQVVGHGAGDNQDQAGAGMGMPADGGSRRELVVNDVDVRLPVRLELDFPAVGNVGVGVDMDLIE